MKGKKANKSVVILLQSLIGMDVRVELKTENVLEGTVEEVSQGSMDLRLSNVTHTSPKDGSTMHMDEMFIMGKMILYVYLPDRLNITAHLKDYVQMIDKNKTMYRRSVRKATDKA